MKVVYIYTSSHQRSLLPFGFNGAYITTHKPQKPIKKSLVGPPQHTQRPLTFPWHTIKGTKEYIMHKILRMHGSNKLTKKNLPRNNIKARLN